MHWIGWGGGGLSMVLAILALVDIFRSGKDRFWIWIILFFPTVGAIAYFVLERLDFSSSKVAWNSPGSAKKRAARAKLKELAPKMAHFKSAAMLSEAADCELTLGHLDAARALFDEAFRKDPDDEHTRYGYARALAGLARYREAREVLAPVIAAHPGHAIGEGALLLARCQMECSENAAAEETLRTLLKRHAFFEARVRLARLLDARGETQEARSILTDLLREAEHLPPHARKEQAPWIREARERMK